MSITETTAETTTGLGRALVLATVSLCTLLYAMTITIANVVLPQMRGALSVTQEEIAWVVTFNIVATAVATPLTGWAAGRFGRFNLMFYAVLGFTLASILCGLADSLEQLVIYRVAQGAFGAPLVPLSQAIILDTFPKRQHSVATAVWGMGVVVGPIIGPTLGGYVAELQNWRWVFFMIVPFGVIALMGVWLFITDRRRIDPVRLDWTGFLTLSVAIAAFQIMLDRGERLDWFESGEIVIGAGVALAAFYLFVVHSLTAAQPFLSPRLLADRNFAVGLFLVLLFGMLNFTPMVLFPALLQELRGYPDSVIGLLLATRGLGNMLSFLVVIPLTRMSPRLALAIGFGAQAASGFAMAGFDINLTTWGVAWTSMLQGFGVGMTWVPLTIIAFATLNPRFVPEGTAVFHLLRNIGSSIFISLSVALVIRSTKTTYAGMTEHVSPFNELLSMPWVSGLWSADGAAGLAVLSGEIERQAAMIGYVNAFYAFAITGVIALPFIWLARLPRRDS